jgi:hypothetical protein
VNFLGLIYLVLVLAIAFVPILLGRRGRRPGPDSDSDDGWGRGPEPPPTPPTPPRGGIPLADADQASVRLRGHAARAFERPVRRRGPATPARTPARRPESPRSHG